MRTSGKFQPEARAPDHYRPVREAPARWAAERDADGAAAAWGPARPAAQPRAEDLEQQEHKRRRDRRSREDQEQRTPCPTTLSEASTTASLGVDELHLRDHRIAKLEQVRKYAHTSLDLGVLGRFLELTFDRLRSPQRVGALACAGERPEPPLAAMKLVLRAMKLLHLCDYGHEDVCVLLAHTSLYFKKTFSLCGAHMDRHEVANALVLLLFVAHSYLLDETCPLSVWHQHLFAKYCSMRTLNAAVFRLLDIRGFRLKLDRKDVDKRFAFLRGEGEPPPPTPQCPPARPRDGPVALAPAARSPG